MRLIDADRLLSEQMRTKYYHLPNGDTAIPIVDIEHAPTVGGWISVDEKMPDDEEIVIGYTPRDGYMFVGFHVSRVVGNYDWSSWYIITSMRSTKKITKKVTHWMPLPQPPEKVAKWE